MGFKRKMGRAASVLALLTHASLASAAGAREPLVVTALSDPETHLVAQPAGGAPEDSARDAAMNEFARAITQAAAADQQAIAARCQAVRAVPARVAVRAAWEANCRYKRR